MDLVQPLNEAGQAPQVHKAVLPTRSKLLTIKTRTTVVDPKVCPTVLTNDTVLLSCRVYCHGGDFARNNQPDLLHIMLVDGPSLQEWLVSLSHQAEGRSSNWLSSIALQLSPSVTIIDLKQIRF
ncbi:hypothetical protein E2C01_010897 [Portunus trituberculatus]|uniref:Uncharacterized protein n=1 Tax=Portunus trituberculatus TaxID=210409 RepID=A0A5B7D9V1_PORTR|nr:hypothetical protein [Portunus trituberculatus]